MVGDDKLVHLVVFSEAAPSFRPLSEKEEDRTSSETTPAEVIFREDITIDTHCFLTDLLGAMEQSFVYATGDEKEKTLISLGPEIFIRAEGLDKKRSCWLFSTYLEFLGPWSVEEKIAKCIVQIIQLLRLGQVDCRAYEPFQETLADPFRESHPDLQIINRSERRTLTSYRSVKEYLRFVGFSRDLDEIIVSKDLVASLRESYFQDPSSERLKDLVKVCTARGLERKRLVNPQILAEIGLFIIREGSPEHFSVFAEAVQVAVECKKLYRPWLPSDPVIYMAPEEIDSALAHRALGGIVEPDTMRATVEKYGWLVTG